MTTDTTPEQTQLELPDYHGQVPVGMKTSLTGAGGRTLSRSDIGERRVLIVEVKTSKAGHEETDRGLIYTEARKIVDLWEILDPKQASRLLVAMRQSNTLRTDTENGTVALEGDGIDLATEGWTDQSGVVLTPAEIADIQGDPVAAVIGPVTQSVVVKYQDGARSLWPADFAADTPMPTVGQQILDDGTLREVAEVLDAETAEPVQVDAPTVDEIAENTTVDAEPPALHAVPDITDGVPVDDVPPMDPDDDPVHDAADTFEQTEAGATLERRLPTQDDFAAVDVAVSEIGDMLEDVVDLDHAHRLLNAERQGRGRALKPRKGALDKIYARIESIESSVTIDPDEV